MAENNRRGFLRKLLSGLCLLPFAAPASCAKSDSPSKDLSRFESLKRRIAELFGRDRKAPPKTAALRPHHKPYPGLPVSKRFMNVRDRQLPDLWQALKHKGFDPGAPVFIRIFKLESELEVWLKRPGPAKAYALFETYKICTFSGTLGPKLKEGDRQSPEGFYEVGAHALNPNSAYHLSFNLGFPNALERALGRTGSFLMVHGNCVSVGCYAMTDARIEPVYTLVYEALGHGQTRVPVHAFPFRMTAENMRLYEDPKWMPFWESLKHGFDAFENTKTPPRIFIKNKTYRIAASD